MFLRYLFLDSLTFWVLTRDFFPMYLSFMPFLKKYFMLEDKLDKHCCKSTRIFGV